MAKKVPVKKHVPVSNTDKYAVKISVGQSVLENMHRYSMEVIEDRAVPDFRDGLKPVQRRALYTMKHDLGLSHTGATVKSSKIVGTGLGSYHPHGDKAMYDALTELYHKRYRLVMPRGNFGSDLASPSAMRYTEAKFTKIAQEIFADLEVAEMTPNYDGSTKEPLVLNPRIPLMLMNGGWGIAVGLSFKVPPHNLRELTEALIYIVKHFKTVTIEDVMKFVQGPDYMNGGRITSSKSEIMNVYRTGRGPIECQCEYTLDKDDEGRTIINVIGYPEAFHPSFSVPAFISACQTMQAKGLVHAVEDEYIDSRFKEVAVDGKPLKTIAIRVTVSNKKGFDAVMKRLNVRCTYEFYSTKRTSDGTELKTYNFLEILKHWVKWRKGEEKKTLELAISKLNRSLFIEETRLIAMQPKHIDIIADGLKQSKIDFEAYICKYLKVTEEQAKIIADMKVGNLRRASIPEQEKKIADLKSSIAKNEDDLQHLSRVVIRHLKALSPCFDDRRTKIGGRVKDTTTIAVAHTGDPVVMMAARDGKLFTNVNEKGTTTADVFATASYDGSVIFDESGLTSILSPSECTGKAGPAYKSVVGIAPADAPKLVVVGRNGYGIKIAGAESQKQSEFNSIKGTQVLAGFGASDDDSILIWGKKQEEFACLRVQKIKEVRKNTAGTKFVNFKPVKAVCVRTGQSLYTAEGSRLYPMKGGDVDAKTKTYVLGAKNIVIYKSGRRKFFDQKATVKEIANDRTGVRFVYPVDVVGAVESAKEQETKADVRSKVKVTAKNTVKATGKVKISGKSTPKKVAVKR